VTPREEYIAETGKDWVYYTDMDDTADYTNEYVKWLENKYTDTLNKRAT